MFPFFTRPKKGDGVLARARLQNPEKEMETDRPICTRIVIYGV